MKITDVNFWFFLTIIILKNEKQLKIQKKFVKIKLSQNLCQNDIINDDVIIKFSKFRFFFSSL